MVLSDFKITDADITSKGVQASPDQLSGTAEDNKKVFDRLTSGPVRDGHNKLIDALVALGVEQLIQNVTAAGRQAGPDMLPGVLGRNETADVDEPQQRLTVPLFQRFLVGAALLELGQLLVRIIDQSRQLGPRPLRHGIPQHNVYLFADDAGSGVQDMYERLVLAVQVAHEVLGAFGQLEQCLCADDLAGGRCLRGVVPGQKAQIFQVVPDLFGLCTHGVLQIM